MSDSPGVRLHFAEPLTRTMIVLLITMTVVFVLQVLSKSFNEFAVEYLALNTATFLGKFRIWQAATAIFMHGSPQHFLGNMLFFWFFGSALARAWRPKEFLFYFFLCGIGASLCFYGFNVFRAPPGEGITGLGASGAIFGLMIAYAMIYGERTVLAFFIIPMKAKHFVAICFALDLLLLVAGTKDGVGHIAHLGGAVFGAVYLKWVWRRQSAMAGSTRGAAKAGSRMAGLDVMDDDD